MQAQTTQVKNSTQQNSDKKSTEGKGTGGWRTQLKEMLRGGSYEEQQLMLKPSAGGGAQERTREGSTLADGAVVLAPQAWQGEPHQTGANDASTHTRATNPDLAPENANRSNTNVTYESHAPGNVDATGDVEYGDVSQGNLGDCYLMASLSAVARTDPARIENMITFLGNNRYRVRFYEYRFLRGYCAHYETITATFPTSGGSMMYGSSQEHSAANPELWPAIIERAYAQWKGGYGDMEGGSAETALEHITGVEADTEDVSDYSDASLVQELRSRLRGGHPVVADTPGSGKKVARNGFVTGHSYTVVSVSGNNITVRNPWGGGGAEQTVTAAIFREVFVRLRLSDA